MADIFGTSGNDNLIGTPGEDRLVGSLGNDVLDGAGNSRDEEDRVDYSGGAVPNGVTINNTDTARGGVAAYTVDKGPAGMDTLIGVESVLGSDFNDTIYIDALSSIDDEVFVHDGAGNDTVIGFDPSGNGAGLDIIVGSGDDTYTGLGYNGNRLRMSDWGRDPSGAMFQGVTVNFTGDQQGTLTDGWGGNDTFTGFGRITGSDFGDVMNGSTGRQRLEGRDGNDTLNGGDGDDNIEGGNGADILDGGAGWDHLNYYDDFFDGGTGGIVVDLLNGTALDGWGNTDQISNFESVTLGMANDQFVGDGNDGWVEGYAGNDTIDGGGGWDTANYDNDENEGGTQGINADLGAGTIVDGFGDTDTVSNIEEVRGTSFDDTMTAAGVAHDIQFQGRDGNDNLTGGDGSDQLNGDDGNDFVSGGAGDDGLSGDDGNDNLSGGDGDDWISAGQGTDNIDGGTGWDTAAYDDGSNNSGGQGINANLTTGVVIDSHGDTDTLANIEQIVGSHHDDTITAAGMSSGVRLQGRDGDDMITGGDGDDRLRGDDGNDMLFGGDGEDDRLEGGQGDDMLDGGAGGDDEAQYWGDINDYTLTDNGDGTYTMVDNNTADGDEGTDILTGIEELWFNGSQDFVTLQSLLAGATGGDDLIDLSGATGPVGVVGLDGNDTLIGGAFDDSISGNDGDDSLTGGDGNDDIYGGSGNDVIDAVDPSGPNFDYIEPGEGNDVITGDGDDMVSYQDLGRNDNSGTDWGVTVDLIAGTGVSNSNGATNDTFTGISNVAGTHYDDTILGSNNGWRSDRWEWFEGKGGADLINGRGGWDVASYNWDGGNSGIQADLANNTIIDTHGNTDTVYGVEGVQGTDQADSFIGDAGENLFRGLQGDDTMDGGAGLRDQADYSEDERRGASQGINANLASGIIIDGFGDTDTVTNIEFVTGTSLGDTMVASDTVGAILSGRDGDDNLTGGAMSDILWGGNGSDVLMAAGGNDLIGGLAGSNNVADGGAGYDTAYLDGDRADFTFAQTANGWDVTDTRDNTVNQLSNIEAFEFNDGVVTLAQIAQNTGVGSDIVDQSAAGAGVTIDLGNGDDMATGSAFDDVISAGNGMDVVNAGDGNDRVTASQGDNSLSGEAGDDVISTLSGHNTLDGGSDNDFVMGGIGNDNIKGGSGNDVLMGDIAGGFGGSDTIEGGAGDDLMMGGVGSDVFVFGAGDGNDQIGTLAVDVANPTGGTTISGHDFQVGIDVIELVGLGYADGAEALTHVSDVNGVAVFDDAAQGLSITLHGLVTADLSASDFNIV